MLNIRIVAAGAVCLLLSGMTAGGAAAQTATNETPGKPLLLLQIVEQPNKTKARRHAHSPANSIAEAAAEKTNKTHSAAAERKQPRSPAPTETATVPASIWPAANSAAPIDIGAAEPAPPPVSAPTEPALGQLVVGGRMVQLAQPDNVNDIDRAADSAAAPANTAAPGGAAANAAATSDTTAAEPKAESKAASAPPQRSEVGSAAWIAQVLAALGGAVVAGSAAWFLIGSAPQRTYG